MSPKEDLSIIPSCFAARHGASIRTVFDDFATIRGEHETTAALGYRRASEGSLFLECYLDQPVEVLVGERLGKRVCRSKLVEIGNLASVNPMAMIGLWGAVANDLGGESEIAVATLTASLRAMFGRIGIPFLELAPANPEGRIADIAGWGRYYKSDPVVCFGEIGPGQEAIARFMARRSRTVAA